MLFTSSQRKGKIAVINSPMLDSESEADTDVSSHCSIPDSVEPTTTGECQFVPPAANDV